VLGTFLSEEEPFMPKPPVLEVDELNFESAVLQSPGPVLVDFTAPWCPPCRAMEPVLRRIAEDEMEPTTIASVDSDANPSLGSRFGVRGLPTMIVFAGGKEIARRLGSTTEAELRRWLRAIADRRTA
jgi:thioredoxin 1